MMPNPNVHYMNQSAPFWDFVAGLEQQGSQHPFLGQNRTEGQEREGDREQFQSLFNPWGRPAPFGAYRDIPYRGPPPHDHPPHHKENEQAGEKSKEKAGEKDTEMNDANDNGEGPSGHSGSDNEGHRHGHERPSRWGGRRGRCGPGGRGFGPRHGCPPGPGPHHGFNGGRGGWGGWGRGNNDIFNSPMFTAQLWDQFVKSHPSTKKEGSESEDFTPEADIFDTENAFVVHISLPGAKKEDIGVNWDVEKSELSIAGVIHRPGNEEFLKTLAMNERKVGPFERKIRLGTRASPAHIDADAISAKLEDGVLRVEAPKLDAGYVEIRKVDIE